MKMQTQSTRGFSLTSVVIATVLLAVAAGGIVRYAQTVGQHRRDMDTRVQENSYRAFQAEIALSGANPTSMVNNPLTGVATAASPDPTIALVSSAGRDQAGSAGVSAYSASSDEAGRAGAIGFRIESSGTAVPPPVAVPLLPPSFRISGTVPESEFTPNLTNLILPNATNPPGTVYRYTIDGSDPTSSSPIWDGSSYLLASPLPETVKSAAFNTDPSFTPSPIVTATLDRNLSIVFARLLGGASTGFYYSEVSGGTNGITLTVPNAPAGTTIYYTYDGAAPTTSSLAYAGSFHVPLASWSASVQLRAMAVSGQSNVSIMPLTVTLTPTVVPLPSPTFGARAGTTTSATVPLNSIIPGATIRYDIDQSITGSSPTVTSGASVTVTAPN